MGYSVLTPGLVGRQTNSSVKFNKWYERGMGMYQVQYGPKQEGVMYVFGG